MASFLVTGPGLEGDDARRAALTDAVLATGVAAFGVAELVLAGRTSWLLAVLIGVGSGAPVLLRSRWPALAVLGSALAFVLAGWLLPNGAEALTPLLAPVLALWTIGRMMPVGVMLLALVVEVGALAATTRWLSSGFDGGDAAVLSLIMLMAMAVGRASREMQLESDLVRSETEQAAAAERLRVARELHDVLGHSVGVMGIQAAAVRRRLRPDQQVEVEALLAVERAGREAVTELRRLLGVLRGAQDQTPPEPSGAFGLASTARLLAVVDDVRGAGLPVSLYGGELVDELPPAAALTVLRVVQEGLTNVLRHAPGASAEVVLERGGDRVSVRVEDHGGRAGAAGHSGHSGTPSGGYGLVGLAERVAAFGGSLDAGPSGDGFGLRADLRLGSA